MQIDVEYRNFLVQLATDEPWNEPIAVNFTCRQRDRNGQWVTADQVKQHLRHFRNRLNRNYLGNRWRKCPIQMMPVIEVNLEGRLHIHMMLETPIGVLVSEYRSFIEQLWDETPISYFERHIAPVHSDAGWAHYITKYRSKPDYLDCIVWDLISVRRS